MTDEREIIADAYNRRIAALYDAITAWATWRGVTTAPADSAHGAGPGQAGRYSVDLTRDGRLVTVRLFPSWEQEGPADAFLIIENEDEGLRMIAYSGDSGMPTAATVKGMLTGLLFPEDMAHP